VTAEERAELDRQTTEERRAQGLPPKGVQDPGILARVARLVAGRSQEAQQPTRRSA
jgi:hypothetical protein